MSPLDPSPFPDRLAAAFPGSDPALLAEVESEHARWRTLHDRLIALIAALIDDAVDRGEPLAPLLDRLVAATAVPVSALVGVGPTPESVAALLRAHGSYGEATTEEVSGTVGFEHDCGTGLRRWRSNPALTLVREGEVPGVPAGVPRYCARCIHAITDAGAGRWRVTPPADPSGRCTWQVDAPPS